MSPLPASFLLPQSVAPGAVLEALADRLSIERRGHRQLSRTYLDTFDWALEGGGLTLTAERANDSLVLRLHGKNGTVSRTIEGGSVPDFVNEIPAGRLRDAVAGRVKMRRFLPQAAVDVEEETWVMLDKRRKIVARLLVEARLPARTADVPADAPLPVRLTAVPVKGYDREMKALVSCLRAVEVLIAGGRSERDELLDLDGRRAGDYSSKIKVKLEPSAPARRAVKDILTSLLGVMVANESGVRRDLDSEFLHDFRVAVRRTRTALGQIRDVLPPAEVAPFREAFSWLGSVTGPTRDLDVYLLKMADYRKLLPAAARDDLAPLEQHLVERQREEQRLLVSVLDSERYSRLMADWQSFLDRNGVARPEAPLSAAQPVSEVAAREIRRAWTRVLKRGGKIKDSSPVEKLHRLRIDCKKLRYLLEFFRSLAPADEVKEAIAALKKLQDNLGDFNDYSVQQEMLAKFAVDLSASGQAPPATLLAMGRLVERLEHGERQERTEFSGRFKAFAAPRSRRIFDRLLRDIERGAVD